MGSINMAQTLDGRCTTQGQNKDDGIDENNSQIDDTILLPRSSARARESINLESSTYQSQNKAVNGSVKKPKQDTAANKTVNSDLNMQFPSNDDAVFAFARLST